MVDKLEKQRKTLFLRMSEAAMKDKSKPIKKANTAENPNNNESTIKPRKSCGGCKRKRK